MPSYEYFCAVSGEEFEEFHSIMIVLEECSLCKMAGRPNHIPKRLISGGSGKGIMQLSDDEFKASLPGEVAKMKRDFNQSTNKFANFIGEDRFHRNELERTKK